MGNVRASIALCDTGPNVLCSILIGNSGGGDRGGRADYYLLLPAPQAGCGQGAGRDTADGAGYVRALLAQFPDTVAPSSVQERTGLPLLREPLSTREREVMRLVATGLSNQETAAQLSITAGAVKKHLSNIYRKLGVSSRTQALARARELDLL